MHRFEKSLLVWATIYIIYRIILGSVVSQSMLHIIYSSKSHKLLTFRRNCNIYVCGQTLILVMKEQKQSSLWPVMLHYSPACSFSLKIIKLYCCQQSQKWNDEQWLHFFVHFPHNLREYRSKCLVFTTEPIISTESAETLAGGMNTVSLLLNICVCIVVYIWTAKIGAKKM